MRNMWIALGKESQNQLLPHHKILNCIWLSHNTTNKANRTADKPTMMDISQLTAVAQPPGLHGLNYTESADCDCKLSPHVMSRCRKSFDYSLIVFSKLFFSYVVEIS